MFKYSSISKIGVVVLITIAGLGCLIYGDFEHFRDLIVKEGKSGGVLFVGLMVTVLGWIMAANVALHNSRKQHTINILLQSRLSPVFKENRELMGKVYPACIDDVAISQEHIDTYVEELKKHANSVTIPPASDRVNALLSCRYLLNYYEFVAIGIHNNDLDECLLKQSLEGIVFGLCQRSDLYIKYLRKEKDGVAENPKVYENLLDLRNKWVLEDKENQQKGKWIIGQYHHLKAANKNNQAS